MKKSWLTTALQQERFSLRKLRILLRKKSESYTGGSGPPHSDSNVSRCGTFSPRRQEQRLPPKGVSPRTKTVRTPLERESAIRTANSKAASSTVVLALSFRSKESRGGLFFKHQKCSNVPPTLSRRFAALLNRLRVIFSRARC